MSDRTSANANRPVGRNHASSSRNRSLHRSNGSGSTGGVDRVIAVGERSVLGRVRDLADRTDVSDATGKPEAALDDAFRDFWRVRIRAI